MDCAAGLSHAKKEPIAVVGVGCRFPGGVDSPESYWELLSAGRDALIDIPRERWQVDFRVLDKVTAPDGRVSMRKSLVVENGKSAIAEA